MLTRSLGSYDKTIRIVMGLMLLAGGWYVAFILSSAYGLLIAAGGVVAMFTALLRWCPIYAIIGINSCPLHDQVRV